MEKLLHYVWKHRMLPLRPMATVDGRALEVLDPGLHNSNSGPDFFNAKIRLDGVLWVGNVEIHDKASDWYAHGHDHDAAYSNVVLHVVGMSDAEILGSDGLVIPQVQVTVPPRVEANYRELLSTDQYPPCYRVIPSLGSLAIHSWLSALQTERLEQKTQDIEARARRQQGDWEAALFITLARNFGFGINGAAFEQWAESFPLSVAGHHRDDAFQVEALFMGQAGLLHAEALPEQYREAAQKDEYFQRLCSEYSFLAHKYHLTPVSRQLWRFLRLRPQNFPHIRIAQLTSLYCSRQLDLSRLAECKTVEQIGDLLHTQVTPYWQTHYAFGSVSPRNEKHLSAQSLNLIFINTAIPMLFAYGRHLMDDSLCEQALTLLEQLKPENNMIVRMWKQCGLTAQTAGDSQALIQLKRQYCDRRDCLRCRFGYEYLKKSANNTDI